MAIGKGANKKGGKGGAKKRTVDPFLKKEWYDFKAPVPFERRTFGKTCVTRTTGQKIASDVLKGRVVESSLADLNEKSDNLAWKKFKLQIEDVEGKNCMTQFHGMDITRDKLCQFIRKWQTLIEAHCEVKTADGYLLRVFCIGFTQKNKNQIRKTAYAHSSQIKQIRRKMIEVITKEISSSTITELIQKFITESIGEQIEKACRFIYPLQNVVIRKVKSVRKPKLDAQKLRELYDDRNIPRAGVNTNEDEGAKNLLAQ